MDGRVRPEFAERTIVMRCLFVAPICTFQIAVMKLMRFLPPRYLSTA